MDAFTFDGLPTRVLFGQGALQRLPGEVTDLGFRRVAVLCTPGKLALGEQVAGLIADRCVGVLPRAVMHVPSAVAENTSRQLLEIGADGCVAVGGGSTIGLAKAVVLNGGPAYLAVPTTYAGSEMTPVWGLTIAGVKRTGRDPRVRPRGVLYDPELTLSLPPEVSLTSGINALAHAVEASYAPDSSPVVDLMAAESITALLSGIPAVLADPADPSGRSQTLYGAWLAGNCLGSTVMGLHHQLCHVLGGTFGLPHAETHSVLLPHVLGYNAAGAQRVLTLLEQQLGDDPVLALWDWARGLGAPTSLASLGLKTTDLGHAVDLATGSPYANPVPVEPAGLRALLGAALEGTPPER